MWGGYRYTCISLPPIIEGCVFFRIKSARSVSSVPIWTRLYINSCFYHTAVKLLCDVIIILTPSDAVRERTEKTINLQAQWKHVQPWTFPTSTQQGCLGSSINWIRSQNKRHYSHERNWEKKPSPICSYCCGISFALKHILTKSIIYTTTKRVKNSKCPKIYREKLWLLLRMIYYLISLCILYRSITFSINVIIFNYIM